MATKNYQEKAKEARLKVLEMIHKAGTSHIASNFSIIDIAVVLYDNLKEGDEVVWSKGWAAATIYYFLAQQGKIPEKDLELFAKEVDYSCVLFGDDDEGSIHRCSACQFSHGKSMKYLGLAETNIPGVYVNGGSMGHGLPVACGMAYAKKLAGDPGKVYCIMSDGEMNEGTTWESVMFAAHHKLDNLVVIVDKNKWQAMGRTEDVLNVKPDMAFLGFGWKPININGHDVDNIEGAILFQKEEEDPRGDRPLAIIANTIKGKGVSFFEDHLLYHYKNVDKDEYEQAVSEIKGN